MKKALITGITGHYERQAVFGKTMGKRQSVMESMGRVRFAEGEDIWKRYSELVLQEL